MTGSPPGPRTRRPVLVTGGCGFLGCNLTDALAARGENVVVLDSFVRPGAEENADWLKSRHGENVAVEVADIRDMHAVQSAVASAKAVLHLAAQVAVTTSLERPAEDFEVNARGTLNVLESVRQHNPQAPVLFASTNKVYGKLLTDHEVVRGSDACGPAAPDLIAGVDEGTPLDFYSPYGCSKGAADQYVRDYARVYGLRALVLRMSCIYGPRQFGTEDQGWLAHFLIQAIRGQTITIYGDGLQVRDALYVGDAVAAWLGCLGKIDRLGGCIFNLGGGPGNAVSLRQMIDIVAELRGVRPEVRYGSWRPGDQPWYVSDISAIRSAIGWEPKTGLREGVRRLQDWLEGRFGPGGRAQARSPENQSRTLREARP